jgi:hypothetical protein
MTFVHTELLSTGRHASPHNAHRQKRLEKREKKTACSEPLTTRQTRTGSYDPAGYFISVSAVI